MPSGSEPGPALRPALTPAQQSLADAIDAALPQTQCTRCGEPDCRRYAEAIARGLAPIDRCPPGGAEGVRRLAALTGQAPGPIDPRHGQEGPRQLAVIDEAACIGCALCIQACPVDCILGIAKHMHTVIESQCTGCELCIPACPVDCISLVPTHGAEVTSEATHDGAASVDGTPPTGWAAWSPAQAEAARQRYAARNGRRAHAAAARMLSQPAAAAAVQAVQAVQAVHTVQAVQSSADQLAAQATPSSDSAHAPSDPERKRAAIEEALRRARLRRAPAP